VQVQPENQTLASITFPELFRMYRKALGMTGTALTEADELFDIYKLEVVGFRPMWRWRGRRRRRGLSPQGEKYAAILASGARQCRLQPVVRHRSIEKSEVLADI